MQNTKDHGHTHFNKDSQPRHTNYNHRTSNMIRSSNTKKASNIHLPYNAFIYVYLTTTKGNH